MPYQGEQNVNESINRQWKQRYFSVRIDTIYDLRVLQKSVELQQPATVENVMYATPTPNGIINESNSLYTKNKGAFKTKIINQAISILNTTVVRMVVLHITNRGFWLVDESDIISPLSPTTYPL